MVKITKYKFLVIIKLNLQYDAVGNLITGDSFYREYDGFNHLLRIRQGNSSSGNITEELIWHPIEERVFIKKRYWNNQSLITTIKYLNKNTIKIKNESGTFNFYYIYQDNVLVARQNSDGTKWFYHSDHLGSTTLITDQNGNVVENEFFSPYGESLDPNTAEEFKLYTGQFKDGIDCQYYYGSRYYNDCIHRFINPDLGIFFYIPQLLNRYSYGLNNPYRYTDESGNIPVDTIADVGFIGYDIYELFDEGVGEDYENLKALGLDIAGAAIPYATGLGLTVRTGGKVVSSGGRIADAGKVISKGNDVKIVEKTARDPKAVKDFLNAEAAKSDAIQKFGNEGVEAMAQGKIPSGFQVHHKTPLYAGGTNKPSNLQITPKGSDPTEHPGTHFKGGETYVKYGSPSKYKPAPKPAPPPKPKPKPKWWRFWKR